MNSYRAIAIAALVVAGCGDSPTAPELVGASGIWQGTLVNLIADGTTTFPGHEVELHINETADTIRGTMLSSLIEDQAFGGLRDGEKLVLTLLHDGATLHMTHSGDNLEGTARVPHGSGTVRIYRAAFSRAES